MPMFLQRLQNVETDYFFEKQMISEGEQYQE
jgi:hypothetical protein